MEIMHQNGTDRKPQMYSERKENSFLNYSIVKMMMSLTCLTVIFVGKFKKVLFCNEIILLYALLFRIEKLSLIKSCLLIV
jgi:hypothetical protein